MKQVKLDDLYRMTAYIYSEQNAIRPVAATFSHFVEVCGMLTIHDRRKKKEGLSFVDALCKALGWYFPLMAKLRVRSVEDLIFRKYPRVCPYCRKAPHVDRECKTVRGTASTVNHEALRRAFEANSSKRPVTLDDWQQMFQDIYPRSADDKARSTLGLFEELGELAEAVRVFERYPRYFAGEAADAFSYLMGLANEHSLRVAQDSGEVFSLHEEYLKRYPGLCIGCGHRVCVCPSIPRSTVGRMSKELEIGSSENLFEPSADAMLSDGHRAAAEVLEVLGGYRKLAESFPADRGDANSAMVLLFLKLAAAVEKSQPLLAGRFHGAAIELGSAIAEPGTRADQGYLASNQELLVALRDVWRNLHDGAHMAPVVDLTESSLAFKIGSALARLRVLVVHASPFDEDSLRVSSEVRAIKEAVRLAGRTGEIEVEDLPAATIDDLRRALLSKQYEVVHFSGHASADSLVLEDPSGASMSVRLDALAELIGRYPTVRCVVLNACHSVSGLTQSIAPFTIGMEASVDDDSAIEFARGFYDAIARGKSVEFAVSEGAGAARLKGLSPPVTKLLSMP
jgi:NTP pyrophosphatase (non-canonical NTP hydrolase)